MSRALVVLAALLGLAVAGLSEAALAQETPAWIRSQSQDEGPPPPAPPDLPDTPPMVPIDGGLLWLALAGGGYAAYRLRRARSEA